MEMEVLKSCNRELMSETEELSAKAKQNVDGVQNLSKRDVIEHQEFRRLAELMEGKRLGISKACLEDVRGASEAHVKELESETRALKERCAVARRRRKLALDGLRADMSLLANKLAVLEGVAHKVSASLDQACSDAPGRAATRPQRSRPQVSPSPYAQRRRERPSQAQNCGRAALGVRSAAPRRVGIA